MPLRTRLSQLMRNPRLRLVRRRGDFARSPVRGSARAGDRPADHQHRAHRRPAPRRGVTTRFWSPTSPPAGRTPGTTKKPSGQRACARRHFGARADDAVDAATSGEVGEALDLLGRRAGRRRARARSVASRLVRTVTATTLVSAGAAAFAASSIARPPAAWTVRIAGFSGASAVDRLGDGVGNVVELEVEEDRQPELGNPLHAVRSVRGEEFEAELQRRRHARGQRSASALRAGRGRACRWRRRSASYDRLSAPRATASAARRRRALRSMRVDPARDATRSAPA